MKITKEQLKQLIKEELNMILEAPIEPWNARMNLPDPARDAWYEKRGGEEVAQEEHYKKLIKEITPMFGDVESLAKQFLSDMFARGFSTAAEEHQLGADVEAAIEKAISEAGYLSRDGSTKQPWEK